MEFEIKGVKYRTAKLDVFQQLKVSRKLLPVLAGLVSDFGTLKSMMVRDSEGKLVFGEKGHSTLWISSYRRLPIRWQLCLKRTLTR
jgi:hypothetical protein